MKSLVAAAAVGALGACACANMEKDSYSAEDSQNASEVATAATDSGPAVGAMASSGSEAAVSAETPMMTASSPEEFASEGLQLAMLTVEASKRAAAEASDAEVKAFATQAQSDHQAIVDRLKAAYPEAAAELDAERSTMLAELAADDAAAFDEDYLDLLADSHERAIALYRSYADNTVDEGDESATTGQAPIAEGDVDVDDAAVIAQETLPKLEAHLAEIERLDAKTPNADDMTDANEIE